MTIYAQARTSVDGGYQHVALCEVYDDLCMLVMVNADGEPGNGTNKTQIRIYLTADQIVELLEGFITAIDTMVETDPDINQGNSLGYRYWTQVEIEQDQARIREERGLE